MFSITFVLLKFQSLILIVLLHAISKYNGSVAALFSILISGWFVVVYNFVFSTVCSSFKVIHSFAYHGHLCECMHVPFSLIHVANSCLVVPISSKETEKRTKKLVYWRPCMWCPFGQNWCRVLRNNNIRKHRSIHQHTHFGNVWYDLIKLFRRIEDKNKKKHEFLFRVCVL